MFINCLPGLSGTHEQATLPGGCSIWRSCLGRKPRPPALMGGGGALGGRNASPSPARHLHGHSRKEEKKEKRKTRRETDARSLLLTIWQTHAVDMRGACPHVPQYPIPHSHTTPRMRAPLQLTGSKGGLNPRLAFSRSSFATEQFQRKPFENSDRHCPLSRSYPL